MRDIAALVYCSHACVYNFLFLVSKRLFLFFVENAITVSEPHVIGWSFNIIIDSFSVETTRESNEKLSLHVLTYKYSWNRENVCNPDSSSPVEL